MGLYAFLFLLHVAIAIVGLGPHFILPFILRQVEQQPGAAGALLSLFDRVAKLSRHGVTGMLVTGVLMVWLNPAGLGLFTEPWLAISMVLLVLVVFLGRGRVEPMGRQLAAMVESGRLDPAELGSMLLWARFNVGLVTTALLVIVWLMVLKPGA